MAAAYVPLGRLHFEGELGQPDEAEALRWLQKPADLNDADGMYWLGVLYSTPRSACYSFDGACVWLEKAAAAGGSPSPPTALSPAELRAEGNALFKTGDFSGASERYVAAARAAEASVAAAEAAGEGVGALTEHWVLALSNLATASSNAGRPGSALQAMAHGMKGGEGDDGQGGLN